MSDDPPKLAPDSPTELVETEEGELIERLSGGTATLLLIWLIGVGALSTLLASWVFWFAVTGSRLGIRELFSAFGFYLALAGAAGPCLLWLAGRAQGHSLRWYLWTAARIALVMVGIVLVMVALSIMVMAGAIPGVGAVAAGVVMAALALALSVPWALATWAADRWIARARL
jgi:hypothetical protein